MASRNSKAPEQLLSYPQPQGSPVPNRAPIGIQRTFQVSPSSSLRARVLSGAICCRSVPVGTLNPKCEEYANFPYFSSVAFNGQRQNCPDESKKWCEPVLQTICIGDFISLVREMMADEGDVLPISRTDACLRGSRYTRLSYTNTRIVGNCSPRT